LENKITKNVGTRIALYHPLQETQKRILPGNFQSSKICGPPYPKLFFQKQFPLTGEIPGLLFQFDNCLLSVQAVFDLALKFRAAPLLFNEQLSAGKQPLYRWLFLLSDRFKGRELAARVQVGIHAFGLFCNK